jgi:hypothetical protein
MTQRLTIRIGCFFCITAALFLTLSPFLQSLHLASCRHDHTQCVNRAEGHDSYGLHGCFHPCEQAPTCSGNACSDTGRQQGGGDEKPPPFTCPVCKAFAQLFQSGGIATAQGCYTPQGLIVPASCPHQTISTSPFSLPHRPRAPPLLMDDQLFS